MITLTDIAKSYSSHTQIGPLNLTVPKGGISALVGPNGAGKSTMLTMIGRLLEPDQGTIIIGDTDIRHAKPREAARLVSILRQENHFVTRLTVRQLVGFGRFPYSQGRLNKEDEEHISQAIDFLNLTELENRYLDELSGGQRQRAYVAMVIAQDTEYILLDEPLNNLDIQHAVQMMKMLRRAADELGRTVVIVIHDINFAGRYADYLCAMKDGHIAYAGPPEEIMTDAILTEVFNTPVHVFDTPAGRMANYF